MTSAPYAYAAPASVSVSTTSAQAVLPTLNTPGRTLRVENLGSAELWFSLGDSTVAATQAAGHHLRPGAELWINQAYHTHIAAIAASGASTLQVSAWSGMAVSGFSGSTSDSPLPMTESTLHAGERGVGTSNDYVVTRSEANRTTVATTNETLISAAPAHLLGIVQQGLTAGNITLRDAAATGGGLTGETYNVGAGTTSAMIDFKGAKFTTGLTVQLTAGAFTILWRPV